MIRNLNFAQVVRKFNVPFYNSRELINYREALYVRLRLDSGKKFHGEIAPLKGFSEETFSDCLNQLQSIKPLFNDLPMFSTVTELIGFVNSLDLYPSVRCGIEQVLLYAHLSYYNFDSSVLFDLSKPAKILLNGVVSLSNKQEVLKKVDKLFQNNYTVIKLKVGRENFEEDLEIVEALDEKYGSAVQLRLDVNGKWDIGNAENYLEKLAKFNIEYIEQPVMDTDLLNNLASKRIVDIAADESSNSLINIQDLIADGQTKTIVVKPTIIGGILDLLMMVKSDIEHSTNIIFSSLFETFIGMNYHYFAAAVLNNGKAHGLDTADFILDNYQDSSVTFSRPHLTVKLDEFPPQFNPGNMRWK